ncbi:HNH endonuclease [Gordonia sp. N1V]|uniref:HNH endonuclease n=1 Tax=Gordonia sp. N1V TaxID=3034163 RepID=UPI0023E332BA|nr:HNH endonuclease [Gordonia sp. N1V]MDF3280478.1 HNH endonuclease [Gordonia sp. N1V]
MNDRTCCICGASLNGKRRDATTCSKRCNKIRWDRNNLERKREHNREFKSRHRERLSEQRKADRKADPEIWHERDRRKRESEANKAWWQSYERDKAVKAKRDAEYRRENRERISAAWREWAKRNRHRTSAYNQKRQAAKAAAEGFATPSQVRARIEYYGGKCWICGSPWEHIDHVKPLARGGCNWPSNLRPACRSCNSAKRHTWPYTPAA